MIKLELKEVATLHTALSNLSIKGADAPFVTNILNKLEKEYAKLNQSNEKPSK